MQEPERSEVNFRKIFKLLLKKLYVILLAFFLAVGVGAGLAYAKNKDVHYYGTTMKFRISPMPVGAETDTQRYSYQDVHLATITSFLSDPTFAYGYVLPVLRGEDSPEIGTSEADALLPLAMRVRSCLSYGYNYEKNTNAIFVRVRVLNDVEFAKKLLVAAREGVKAYVEKYMIQPATGEGANGYRTVCEETTISKIGLLNGNQTRTAMMKYGATFGIVALVLVVSALLIADNANSKLHDFERFSEEMDVPVLGVVPKVRDYERIDDIEVLK